MNTRAKFKCVSVTKRLGYSKEGGYVYDAELQAVYGDSAENAAFYAATPSGAIKLATVREDVFEPGQEYFVDFSHATEQAK